MTFQGQYVCPQCRLGSADLAEESRACMVRRLGNTILMKCFICYHVWLHKDATRTNSVCNGVEPQDSGGAIKDRNS